MKEAWRMPDVFDDTETSLMCEAYEIAVLALGLTHEIDDITKTILADCIIRILKTEDIADCNREQDTSALAARSVDNLLMTYNRCMFAEEKTLH